LLRSNGYRAWIRIMNNAFKGQIRTAFTATETEMADLCDDMIYCFQLFEQKKNLLRPS